MDKPNVDNSLNSTQALRLDEPLIPIADLGVLSGEATDKNTQALLTTSLDATPISQPGNLSTFKPSDVYSFSVADDGNIFDSNKSDINLSLRSISAGDDADVSLYRDSNNNGVLDLTSDEKVAESRRGSNNDDAINIRSDAGDYFAKVDRYAQGSSGDVQYQLDLSAAKPSNLLPNEISVGTLTLDPPTIRNGSINSENTSDVYSFGIAQGVGNDGVEISLSGLSSDADIRLIKDINNNKILDSADEILRSSTAGGVGSETIEYSPLLGDPSLSGSNCLVQVYQYTGDTNYTLSLESTESIT